MRHPDIIGGKQRHKHLAGKIQLRNYHKHNRLIKKSPLSTCCRFMGPKQDTQMSKIGVGLEPAIFRSEVQRLIHWATRP